MLRREGQQLCAFFHRVLWRYRSSPMSLNKPLRSRGFSGFSRLSVGNEQGRFYNGKNWVRLVKSSGVGSSSSLSLRSCLSRHNGFLRSAGLSPARHMDRGSEAVLEDDVRLKLVNGGGSCKYKEHLGFPGQPKADKLVVAVDVDEVLGSFLAALNKFIADRYSLHHSVSEYFVYEFFKIWKCSRAEADIRVHEFFKTSYFQTGIQPIPGSQHALHKLAAFCNLSVVTSRQNAIKDDTLQWIEKHYPGLFQEIHFGNHFALDGVARPKSEICRSLGAHVLIDDNPKYALECADVGIRVLLFDYDNSYPWCKTGSAASHPMITKVHNWHEVEQQLLSWVPT